LELGIVADGAAVVEGVPGACVVVVLGLAGEVAGGGVAPVLVVPDVVPPDVVPVWAHAAVPASAVSASAKAAFLSSYLMTQLPRFRCLGNAGEAAMFQPARGRIIV
jgi:hypothetical protein